VVSIQNNPPRRSTPAPVVDVILLHKRPLLCRGCLDEQIKAVIKNLPFSRRLYVVLDQYTKEEKTRLSDQYVDINSIHFWSLRELDTDGAGHTQTPSVISNQVNQETFFSIPSIPGVAGHAIYLSDCVFPVRRLYYRDLYNASNNPRLLNYHQPCVYDHLAGASSARLEPFFPCTMTDVETLASSRDLSHYLYIETLNGMVYDVNSTFDVILYDESRKELLRNFINTGLNDQGFLRIHTNNLVTPGFTRDLIQTIMNDSDN
jgi:hypothetical protein